jgi:hypothetical protein
LRCICCRTDRLASEEIAAPRAFAGTTTSVDLTMNIVRGGINYRF